MIWVDESLGLTEIKWECGAYFQVYGTNDELPYIEEIREQMLATFWGWA